MTTKFVVSHELKLKLISLTPNYDSTSLTSRVEVHFRDIALAGLKLTKIIRYFSAPQ